MSLRKIRVAARSALGFSLMGIMVLVVGALSLMQMNRMHDQSTFLTQQALPSLVGLNEV